MPYLVRALAAPLALAAFAIFGAGAASAATPTNTTALQNAVSVGNDTSGIRQHLKALQVIADANGGTRSTGTPGHEASLAYVKGKLDATGYFNVSMQPFEADVWEETGDPTLSATPPASPPWVANTDFATMSFSGTGSLTNAQIRVIDFAAPTATPSTSTSGCEAADFPADLAGKVAVIQRGTCTFGEKAQNALAAGAAGVLIYNEGTLGDPDRNGPINGTLGGPISIPVLESTYLVGKYLVDHPTATVSMSASGHSDHLVTNNLIAETKTGRTDRAVVVGAHLDSVPEGPGINDDGSGTSIDLETALQMANLGIKPVNQVRFIWFAGEEQGLLGSDYYVSQLSKKQISGISVMLDFDMLASPNYAELIYDGDGSQFGVSGPNGSGQIERVFEDFFTGYSPSQYTEKIPFDGRSDYDAFTTAGIPAGGIFTGAEEHKTAAQKAHWGGFVSSDPLDLAGQFDPCYHLACDRYETNINDGVMAITSDAVAHAVLTFAQTTSAVNGTQKGSANSTKPYDWKGDHLVR